MIQVSTQQIGDAPKYNSTVQYVVQMNEAFFRYMASSTLKLELNQLLLSEWTEIGRASLSLVEVLNSSKHKSSDVHQRTLRVFGPGSVDLGKIRVLGPANLTMQSMPIGRYFSRTVRCSTF